MFPVGKREPHESTVRKKIFNLYNKQRLKGRTRHLSVFGIITDKQIIPFLDTKKLLALKVKKRKVF